MLIRNPSCGLLPHERLAPFTKVQSKNAVTNTFARRFLITLFAQLVAYSNSMIAPVCCIYIFSEYIYLAQFFYVFHTFYTFSNNFSDILKTFFNLTFVTTHTQKNSASSLHVPVLSFYLQCQFLSYFFVLDYFVCINNFLYRTKLSVKNISYKEIKSI